MSPPKNFCCSVCNKKVNSLTVKCCQKCGGQMCPLCNKKRPSKWRWIIKTNEREQLKCSRCNKEGFAFLNAEGWCDECVNELSCFHSHDLSLTHCTLCGEEWSERNKFFCNECWKKSSGEIPGEKVENKDTFQRDTLRSAIWYFLFLLLFSAIVWLILVARKKTSFKKN